MTSPISRIGRIVLVVVALLTAACQTPAPAPVVERAQPPTQKILRHFVARGETLYAIAWRYELDFQRLAAVNGLEPPYQLYPGQKLSLDMSQAPAKAQLQKKSTPAKVTAHPVETARPRPEPPPKITVPPAPALPQAGWQWRWPVRGRVSREYDADKVLKGISIYTERGAGVVAAAPGVVVYAGEGLRGYGRLIIVKHSDKHLSAYAHNKRILVTENQGVSQGEKIAEVGADTSGQPRLYFEIRENGKPVDPLQRLPK